MVAAASLGGAEPGLHGVDRRGDRRARVGRGHRVHACFLRLVPISLHHLNGVDQPRALHTDALVAHGPILGGHHIDLHGLALVNGPTVAEEDHASARGVDLLGKLHGILQGLLFRHVVHDEHPIRSAEPLLDEVLRLGVAGAVQQLEQLVLHLDLVVGHEVRPLLHELVELLRVLLPDELLEQRRLSHALGADELDVDVAVRPAAARGDTGSGGGARADADAHGHAHRRLHRCALQQLLIPRLGFLELVLALPLPRLDLLQLGAQLDELCIPLLHVLLHLVQLLRLDDHLGLVRCELGRLFGLHLGLLQGLLHLLERVLEVLDLGLQALLLRLQLQLNGLQLLVALPQLGRLLRRFLALGHERAHLLRFLLQLLHLLLGHPQAQALLGDVDRLLERPVDALILDALPLPLDLRRRHVEAVVLRLPAPHDALAPRLEAQDALVDAHVLPALQVRPDLRLDLGGSSELPLSLQIHARLLQPEQRLHVARADLDRLVHAHLDLPPPASLDERGALDEQLQPSELQSLEGRQLEEDHGLSHCPRCAMRRLRDAQLLVEVVQQLLGAYLRLVDVLEARHNLRRAQHLVVVPTLLVIDTHRVACSAHLHDLEHTAVPQLLRDRLAIVPVRLVLRVGLDAPDKVGLRQVDNVHQARQLLLELRGDRVLFLLRPAGPSLGRLLRRRREHLGVLPVLLEQVRHELVLTAAHALDDVVAELIFVFVEEAVGAVGDRPSEVLDDEPRRLRLDLVEASVTFVLLDQLVAETRVGTLRHHALLVQDREHTRGLRLQDVDGILIVREVQRVPWDALALVELLFELEDEGVEELLQSLVGEVDADLLERVHLEALEAEDVEHTDEQLDVLEVADRRVRDLHHEVENHAVQGPREGVAVVGSRPHVHRAPDALRPRDARLVAEGGLQVLPRHTGQRRGEVDGGAALLHHHGPLAVVRRGVELRVAQVQHRCDDLQDGGDVLWRDADRLHRIDADLEHGDVVHILQSAARRSGEEREITTVVEAGQVDGARLLNGLRLQFLWVIVRRRPREARRGRARLVEDVVIPLALLLVADAHLLQKVCADPCTAQAAAGARQAGLCQRLLVARSELQLDELAEAAGVVVSQRPRVAERLEQGVGLQHLLLDIRYLAILGPGERQELHHVLRRLCLAGARLAGDEHGLALLSIADASVGGVGGVEDVRLRGRLRGDEALQDLLVVETGDRLERV
mmetsp:Transcript_66995/g.193585  ORF Transcript_66995/g.193585 Transcript_66995/m.193585 type:complete len:1210 (-) Transcript_66995:420-4049(-)